jgi:hypothetical protein
MRELNEHVREALNIKLTERVLTPELIKLKKEKKDYTKAIVWISMVAITVLLWTIIYNLIF